MDTWRKHACAAGRRRLGSLARRAHLLIATLALLAWQYRHNLSAYDAFFVATARTHDLPLLTADARLARAPGLDIAVQYVRMG